MLTTLDYKLQHIQLFWKCYSNFTLTTGTLALTSSDITGNAATAI